MNGRMLLAKSFLLSQIVFPSQFTLIGIKEVKKIERLIYAFVNGARNLYGPEHIARKYLKAERTNGGINGIDVGSFVTAIAMRQFGKAEQFSRPLRLLQSSLISPKDDICKIVTNQLKPGMVKFLRNNPMPDFSHLELILSFPLCILLKQSSNAANLAVQHDLVNLFSIQNEIARDRLPRQLLSDILKGLPQPLARLIRSGNLIDSPSKYTWITTTSDYVLGNSTSKTLKLALVTQKLGPLSVDLNKIHRRLDLPSCDSPEHCQLFSNLWRIKHPALRAIRLKLCYKNIYSNERRFRFGITDSALCMGCDQIESVEHQLFECANAKRLWDMFRDMTGVNIGSFQNVLCCNLTCEAEILKSTIIKALTQINRNHLVPAKVVAQECAYFLRIEAIMNQKREKQLLELVNRLNNVI